MTSPPELVDLERKRYGASYSDGVIDVFVGASLASIGAMWLIFPDYLSGAVALVAVSISPVMKRRKRFVEARSGYVRFTQPRRQRERRIYTAAGFLFAAFMLLARPLGSLQAGDIDWPVGPDSLTTWVLALIAVVLGIVLAIRRLFAYAAILAITGAIAVAIEPRFGWPLLASGALMLVVGYVMATRFVSAHSLTEAP